jgi:diacylglycerol kinase family enzyme
MDSTNAQGEASSLSIRSGGGLGAAGAEPEDGLDDALVVGGTLLMANSTNVVGVRAVRKRENSTCGSYSLLPLRILTLTNPSAGTGSGAAVVARALDRLRADGHLVSTLAVSRGDAESFGMRFGEALSTCDALVIAGGDGTVHHALPSIIDSGVPIYHLPLGTENLFARHFRMTRDAGALGRAIGANAIGLSDIAQVSVDHDDPATPEWMRRFAIMMSIGPDASVVKRLAAVRNGPITHLSYVKPILAELANPWLPRVSAWVDGRQIIEHRRGMLVVANSPQYAVRIDPARHAIIDDGKLDVVFLPAESVLAAGWWLARARLRMHLNGSADRGGAFWVQGGEVRVMVDDASPACQMDGEDVPLPARPTLNIRVEPRALRVVTVPAR